MIQNDLKDIFIGQQNSWSTLGTDYKAGYRRVNHPVAVQIEQTIAQVKNAWKKCISKIFLATDEKSAVERFEKEFPGKVFYFRCLQGRGNTSIAFSQSDRPEPSLSP